MKKLSLHLHDRKSTLHVIYNDILRNIPADNSKFYVKYNKNFLTVARKKEPVDETDIITENKKKKW